MYNFGHTSEGRGLKCTKTKFPHKSKMRTGNSTLGREIPDKQTGTTGHRPPVAALQKVTSQVTKPNRSSPVPKGSGATTGLRQRRVLALTGRASTTGPACWT